MVDELENRNSSKLQIQEQYKEWKEGDGKLSLEEMKDFSDI